MILSFIAAYLPAFIIGVDQNVFVEIKGVVPLKAGSHVKVGGDADGALLVHDVCECVDRPALACADTLVLQLDVLLVVEIGESFIAVEGGFIRSRHLPDRHGNRAAGAFLNREVGPGLAPLEQQLPAFEVCRAEDRSVRAAHPHLRDIKVAAVGDVVSFFFHVYPSFPGGLRLLVLLPP